MEDSASAGHHNGRKRSNDNNAFAKFLPFSPPLGHEIQTKFSCTLSETTTTTTTNFSPHLPNQNIETKETPHFSSPSTSIKRSANSGPSPQSIGSSKSLLIEYVENDGKIGKTVINRSELESVVMSMASEELSKRPKTGGIYKAIAVLSLKLLMSLSSVFLYACANQLLLH